MEPRVKADPSLPKHEKFTNPFPEGELIDDQTWIQSLCNAGIKCCSNLPFTTAGPQPKSETL